MGLCNQQKKVRAPLKPREGPYKKVNAYTSKFSSEQILTFVFALLVIILHSIFNVAAIIKIDHPILYIMLAINYILLIGIIYIYVRITIFDPVDTYITNQNLAKIQYNSKNQDNFEYCNICRSIIHKKSYHCKRCNRCTQDFDHHCVFLNNCIGSLNYELFLSILMLYILFLLNNIGQSIWVFVEAKQNPIVRNASITEWMSIVIIILCFLQLLATLALLGFHCYISCCLDLTTIAFYQSQTQSKKSSSCDSKNMQIEANLSPNQYSGPQQMQHSASNLK